MLSIWDGGDEADLALGKVNGTEKGEVGTSCCVPSVVRLSPSLLERAHSPKELCDFSAFLM